MGEHSYNCCLLSLPSFLPSSLTLTANFTAELAATRERLVCWSASRPPPASASVIERHTQRP